MARNRIRISPAWAKAVDDLEPELAPLNVRDFGCDDFISAPDALPMSPEDRRNVVGLTYEELHDRLTEIAKRLGRAKCLNAYREFQLAKCEWPSVDLRWTLSPHQLRRLASLA